MIEPTTKLLNILYACAHSRLPWGVDWDPWLPLCMPSSDDEEPQYILCCGHTLEYGKESAGVVGAGLMLPGNPDKFGRPTLTITKFGREFLAQHLDQVGLPRDSSAG